MEINMQAPLIAQKQIFIEAAPQIVWKVHTDVSNWSRWQHGIMECKLEGPIAVGSVFRWKSSGLNVVSTIEVIEAHREIAWTGRALGARAMHVWKLTPQNSGTLVTTEESMEGWSIKFLKLINPKFLDNSLDNWLKDLKAEVEKRLQS